MADERHRYWFVAAVFRNADDLAATAARLHARGFAQSALLVVAGGGAGSARTALDACGSNGVKILKPEGDGTAARADAADLPAGLRAFLDAKDCGDRGEPRSHVCAQILQEAAGGALVLIASAGNPEVQLLGARILLQGNCECVLTHEIATPSL